MGKQPGKPERPYRGIIARLRDWWRDRRDPKREQCEHCGTLVRPRLAHHVTTTFDLGEYVGPGGKSGMVGAEVTATYCWEHCGGGCDRGCVRIEAGTPITEAVKHIIEGPH